MQRLRHGHAVLIPPHLVPSFMKMFTLYVAAYIHASASYASIRQQSGDDTVDAFAVRRAS